MTGHRENLMPLIPIFATIAYLLYRLYLHLKGYTSEAYRRGLLEKFIAPVGGTITFYEYVPDRQRQFWMLKKMGVTRASLLYRIVMRDANSVEHRA
jgi:hypothetical protein